MMYVKNDEDILEFIHEGSGGSHGHETPGEDDDDHHGIKMPEYGSLLGSDDLSDLVAAFKVLSGMSVTPADTPERRGADLARLWNCFSCHGPAGSGGYPNPRSFAGFIPGWYGADFRDLVRDREEFGLWVRKGSIKRLANNPVAAIFIKRQKVLMPAYGHFTDAQIDDLWAYVQWLAETEGGSGGERPW